MGFKKRIAAALLMGIGLTLTAAEAVFAQSGSANIQIPPGCDSVVVTFTSFANKPGNTATVSINGSDHTVTWDGGRHSATFPIAAQDGDTVTVDISWDTNGKQGSASMTKTMKGCQPEPEPTEEPTPQPDEECEEEEGEEEEGEDEGEGDEEGEEECKEPAPEETTPPTTPPGTQSNTTPVTQPTTPVTTRPAPQPVPVTAPVAVESQKNDQKDEVKGIVVTRSDSSAVQAKALPAELAFTGPRDQVSALGIVSMLFLMTGLTLRSMGRRRAVQHSS